MKLTEEADEKVPSRRRRRLHVSDESSHHSQSADLEQVVLV